MVGSQFQYILCCVTNYSYVLSQIGKCVYTLRAGYVRAKAARIKCVQVDISACTPEARPGNPNPGHCRGNQRASEVAERRY